LRRLLDNWQHNPVILRLMVQSLIAVYGNAPVLEAAGIKER
jgi:hypothetical protein